MKFFIIFTIFSIVVFGSMFLNTSYAQSDPLSEIVFFQTGELNTVENQFQMSDNFVIREFFNGNIIRISGQTIEEFPYIIYSKITDSEINTIGKIFIDENFFELLFSEDSLVVEDKVEEKEDNLLILVKYSQKVYSKNLATFQIKTFDPTINKLNDFEQNYGLITDTTIKILIKDNNVEIFSNEGVVNDRGLFESEFIMPPDKINTYKITITAENNNSESSKLLQIINMGSKDNLK